MNHGVIERYRSFLPVSASTPVVTLTEGDTPLIPAPKLAIEISTHVRLFIKFEGMNPTGSFKDRGMTLAISKAVEEGASSVICASTGNTSASAAAYAARAGIRCIVALPRGKVAVGKLSQAIMHGARVLEICGNFDEALCCVRAVAEHERIAVVNSVNPHRIQGQKTAAFEVCDALGDAPDYHALPVGNAGNITAYWTGYREYHQAGHASRLPKMLGFQASGAAPLALGHAVACPETIATAIRIGNPTSWSGAVAARDQSSGLIAVVSDSEILEAQAMAASVEGIFAEPASAASLAGLLKLGRQGFFEEPCTVVATFTGHGLKDPEVGLSATVELKSVPATASAILAEIHSAS